MNRITLSRSWNDERKVERSLIFGVLIFSVFTVGQDLIRANLDKSAFYFSESFLFSSFWWLFAPLFWVQFRLIRLFPKLWWKPALAVLLICVHISCYPLLVWALSKTFYYHTFAIDQTFRYALAEYLYLLVIFYTIPVFVLKWYDRGRLHEELNQSVKQDNTENYISSLLVEQGTRKQVINISEVLYFSASPPYITVNTQDKQFLLSQTLKSIYPTLDPDCFLRIHKSTIVNIERVSSYATRNNGDYDLTMDNNTELRVSRNFAGDFKRVFRTIHRLTTD